MDRKQIRQDMNYYYTMPDKASLYGAGSIPAGSMHAVPGSLSSSSMQGPLSSLGYVPSQQSSINQPGANQTSPLSQHQTPSGFSSPMQGPANPAAAYPSVSYGQSPYATQAAMYQSPLAYSQATMAAQNAAYMAVAAGAQSPYAAYPTPPSGQMYYQSALNGQHMYASPTAAAANLPAGMHPHMQQSMNPSMPPVYPSSISSLSAVPPRPTMSAYPAPSPFGRLP